ncbi:MULTISPECIES: hypothetical protein [Paenibacillus]|nr:hypothetical protein [Paenibacillus odorifer]
MTAYAFDASFPTESFRANADAPTAPNFLSVTPSPSFYEQDTKERLPAQKMEG